MRLKLLSRFFKKSLQTPVRVRESAAVVRSAQRDDWYGVIELIEAYRRRRPSDAEEVSYLGAAYFALERYEDIVVEFQRLSAAGNREALEALRPYFASALLWLERNQEALDQFEKMEPIDATPAHRALRNWNHAIALHRVGRTEEARVLLISELDADWPRPEYEQARSLLSSMGVPVH